MDNYDNLGTIGEGTYGVVLKGRHKATGQIVAIKKFKESDEDEQVRKTALREIRILKSLKQDNIVALLEVFRRNRKLYLVFEYVERTILEDLEKNANGMDKLDVKKVFYQLLKALDFIHTNNIVHRDIKPENLLMSKNGVLKLCDFGFARALSRPGSKYTDYVATRWYRAPELLVGDTEYGKAVDIWAAGCMFAEISNGLPLFPGESDIDQLCHIIKCFGPLTARHMEVFSKNPLYVGVKLPTVKTHEPLEKRFPNMEKTQLSILKKCLRYDPEERLTAAQLLQHPYFSGFSEWYEHDLKASCARDREDHDALHQQTRKLLEKKELQTPMAAMPSGASPFGSPDGSPLPSARVDENVDGEQKKRTDRMASGVVRLKKGDSHGAAAAGGGSKTPRITEEPAKTPADDFDQGDDIDYDEDDEKPHHGAHAAHPPPAVVSSMTSLPLSTSLPAVPLPVVRRAVSSDPEPPAVPATSTAAIPLSTSPSSSPNAAAAAGSSTNSNASSNNNNNAARSPIVSPRGLSNATPAPSTTNNSSASVLPSSISGSTPRQHNHSLADRQGSQPPMSSGADMSTSSYHSREPSRVVSDMMTTTGSNGNGGNGLSSLASTGVISEVASGSESRHGSPRSRAQSRVDGTSSMPTEHTRAGKKTKGQSNSISSMSDAKKDGRETDRGRRGGGDNNGGNPDGIGSSRVDKSSHGLPNIRIDTKGNNGNGGSLPHLLSTASDLHDNDAGTPTEAKEESNGTDTRQHSPTSMAYSKQGSKKGGFPHVGTKPLQDARNSQPLPKGGRDGVFPTLVESKASKKTGGGGKKNNNGLPPGSGIGLLTGIGLPAAPLTTSGTTSVTGTASLTASSSTNSGLHTSSSSHGVMNTSSNNIGAPPKSSPSPFERTESVSMYRKQRSPNPGTNSTATEGGFGYKGGQQAKPKTKHGHGPPTYYNPKQPPQLQAVPRRF